MKNRNSAPVALCAAIFLIALMAGCAKTIEFKPAATRTQYFEMERHVSVSMFGMSFGANETMKYRMDVKAVADDRIEMDLIPLELTIARSNSKGMSAIFGSKLLALPEENPEVTIIRRLAGHPIHLRIKPGGTVESMSVEAPPDDKSDPRPLARGEALEKQLQNIFINTHLMMTESILPTGEIRVGKPYKPAGRIFDDAGKVDGNLKLMMVEGIDDEGVATLTVDPSILTALFSDAYSNLNLDKAFPEEVNVTGKGHGRFQYNTIRRCITSGEVSLNTQAKVESSKDLPVAVSFGLRVDIKVREIPAY